MSILCYTIRIKFGLLPVPKNIAEAIYRSFNKKSQITFWELQETILCLLVLIDKCLTWT